MNEQSGTQVVIGAGGAGGAVARRLRAERKELRVVTRRGAAGRPGDDLGGEKVAADATDAAALVAATTGAAVIYHAANVPYPAWHDTLPRMLEATIAAAKANGARLVYVDNLYMYGPIDGPISERSQQRPSTRKGELRRRLAEQLLAANSAGNVDAVIVRGSDFFGPGVVSSAVGDRFFPPLLKGGKPTWMGSLDQPHSLTFIDDLAAACVLLGNATLGTERVWHVPAAAALTGRGYAELACRLADVPSRVAATPVLLLRALGLVNPLLKEVAEMSYQLTAPFVIDGSAFAAAFGFAPTPHEEAMRRTLAWYRSRSV
jgi:nucleoside-diphosphate-sugar epimerase